MNKIIRWFIGYLLQQANKTTAWIGAIGVILTLLHLYNVLFILFICLIIFPEKDFSDAFKSWTESLQNLNKQQ